MITFTIIKVGYTAGIYGCSGEYFHCLIDNEKDVTSLFFQGMYGAEERIREELKAKGYEYIYSQSVLGQLKRNDIPKNRFLSEYQAIENIKNNIY